MLRSDLCGYSYTYIAVKGTITVEGDNNLKTRNKKLTFKNSYPFRSCISKISNAFLDNAEDLDIAMPMYNLLEYSDNYSMTSRSLWNYYRDEINDDANENNAARNKINNNKKITGKSFEYKTKLVERTPNNNKILDAEVVVTLKYFSNLSRSLDLPLINCETVKWKIDLSWSKECIISEISVTPAIAGNPRANIPVKAREARQITGGTFQIYNAKLYVPVVSFSINDNMKFLENIKQGIKITISWNKYRSEITTQPKNDNLDCLIDPKFRNINRLFVLSFKNGSTINE